MNGTIHLPIVLHFHQPVGQFGFVSEEAYQKSYLPLVRSLFNYPNVKANLHFSGPLLEWLQQNHPDFIESLVLPMIDRGQVEILGGGFFEPVLAIIPDEDKRAQVNYLRNFWANLRPEIDIQGAWLTERVWEPSLVRPLYEAGVDYVLIDDINFKLNGLTQEQTYYPVITEDQGYPLTVLAINEKIRYLIPWKPLDQTIELLEEARHPDNRRVLVFIADAEKLGLWPGGERTTYDICYEKGWDGQPLVPALFKLINDTPWIISCTLGEYLQKTSQYARPTLYFQTESYDKMGIWALPTSLRRKLKEGKDRAVKDAEGPLAQYQQFLKGSQWRNFLAKYTESDHLHKKMLFARMIYKEMLEDDRISEDDLTYGYNLLLRAQCNDVYWHGQFGGIYFRFLREIVHSYLILAINHFEEVAIKRTGQPFIEPVHHTSVLLKGPFETILNAQRLAVYISKADGGTVFSIDDKERSYNFSSVMTRVVEAYHPELGEPSKGIVDDLYPRRSFRDRYFKEEPTIDDFFEGRVDLQPRFESEPYEIVGEDKEQRSVTLKVRGTFAGAILEVVKTFRVVNATKSLHVTYHLTNRSEAQCNAFFCPEVNFVMPGDVGQLCAYVNSRKRDELNVTKKAVLRRVSSIQLLNEELGTGLALRNNSGQLVTTYCYPVESNEKSENSWRQNYQGSCLVPLFPLKLSPGGEKVIKLELELFPSSKED